MNKFFLKGPNEYSRYRCKKMMVENEMDIGINANYIDQITHCLMSISERMWMFEGKWSLS